MSKAHEIVLTLYGQILSSMVRSNMPSNERDQVIKQAMNLALEAAHHYAKITEDSNGEV